MYITHNSVVSIAKIIAGIQITILSTDDMDIFNLQLETICFRPLKPLKK